MTTRPRTPGWIVLTGLILGSYTAFIAGQRPDTWYLYIGIHVVASWAMLRWFFGPEPTPVHHCDCDCHGDEDRGHAPVLPRPLITRAEMEPICAWARTHYDIEFTDDHLAHYADAMGFRYVREEKT
jgi:hypothetical protein